MIIDTDLNDDVFYLENELAVVQAEADSLIEAMKAGLYVA